LSIRLNQASLRSGRNAPVMTLSRKQDLGPSSSAEILLYWNASRSQRR
jgi:hypothetical protein